MVAAIAFACTAILTGARPAIAGPTIETLGSGFNQPIGVAVDRSGNVYVSDTGNSAVKEIVASDGRVAGTPSIRTLATGFTYPRGIAVDGDGNVYVSEASDVKEIVATGGTVAESAAVKTLASGLNDPGGVAVDGLGNVYVADTGNNVVKELVAAGRGAPGTPAIVPIGSGFNQPTGVAVDRRGDVYVSAGSNGETAVNEIVAVDGKIPASPTIRKLGWNICCATNIAVDARGNVFVSDVDRVKEIGAIDGSVPNSPGIKELAAGFNGAAGVAVDASGNVYVAERNGNAIKEMLAAGGDVPAPFVLRLFPWKPEGVTTAVAVDRSGNLYLGPQDRLQRFAPVGAAFTATPVTIASGLLVYSGNGVAVDKLGNIWIADWQFGLKEIVAVNRSIRSASTTRTISQFEGSAMAIGVTVDRFGNVYVAQPADPIDFVKEIVATGGIVGASSAVRTLGSGYWRPAGVAVDEFGNVYVADLHGVEQLLAVNGRVPTGPVMRKLWSGSAQSICIDATGNVFVADRRAQQSDAVVEILAPGRSPSEPPQVDVLVSWLDQVSGMATDESGNVFVADSRYVYEILTGSRAP